MFHIILALLFLIKFIRFLIYFTEIKVENGLTWFLICFEKQKGKYKLIRVFFLYNFTLE